MPGPGEYRPDPTVGIKRPEDLPKTKVSVRYRIYRRRPCPHCGHSAYRDRVCRRTLHDLGNTLTGRPRDVGQKRGHSALIWMLWEQAKTGT
jgi:hypothetical protein